VQSVRPRRGRSARSKSISSGGRGSRRARPGRAQPSGSAAGRNTMRVTVSDVVSPSYFPLTAAVELGFFKAEGLDAKFIFPPVDPGRGLFDGAGDFYARSPSTAPD